MRFDPPNRFGSGLDSLETTRIVDGLVGDGFNEVVLHYNEKKKRKLNYDQFD